MSDGTGDFVLRFWLDVLEFWDFITASTTYDEFTLLAVFWNTFNSLFCFRRITFVFISNSVSDFSDAFLRDAIEIRFVSMSIVAAVCESEKVLLRQESI